MNITDVLNQFLIQTETALLNLAKETVGESLPAAKDAIDAYISGARTRVSLLLEAVATGEVDARFLLDRINDEKGILESEGLSFLIIGKGLAENLINGIQAILIEALRNVLPPNINTTI